MEETLNVPAKRTHLESAILRFNLKEATLKKLAKDCMAVTVIDPEDKKGYDIAHEWRMKVKGIRTTVEKIRKTEKAEAISFGKGIEAEANRLKGLLTPLEDHLLVQEKIVDDEKERVRAEKERLRLEVIEKAEEAKRVEEQRIRDQIKAEQEAEAKRLETIRVEQEEKEAEIKAAQDKIIADQKVIDDAKQKAKDDAARLLRDAESKVIRDKMAEVAAEKKVEEERQANIAKEEQEKKDEELRKAMLPDKEKLIDIANALEAIKGHSFTHQQSHDVYAEAMSHVKKACEILKGV